jgi:hypothetical protein
MEAVDKIATLKTDDADAPINPEQAEIIKVTVTD